MSRRDSMIEARKSWSVPGLVGWMERLPGARREAWCSQLELGLFEDWQNPAKRQAFRGTLATVGAWY